MANTNDCLVCNELSENAPDFVVNGVTSEVCTNLQNDKGLSGNSTDCEDLADANDCLIGTMEGEIEKYDVCDWKEYMEKFVPNVHEVVAAIICAICGIWTNIHSIWDNIEQLWDKVNQLFNEVSTIKTRISCINGNLKKVIASLSNSDTYKPVVTSPRSNGSGEGYYYRPASDDYEIRFNMDSKNGNDGTKKADKDYACVISLCCDTSGASQGDMYHDLTFHTSSVPFTKALEDEYGLHVREYVGPSGDNSTPVTGSCYVKKGDSLMLHVGDEGYGNTGQFRVHQFIITWIPIFSVSFKPADIKDC